MSILSEGPTLGHHGVVDSARVALMRELLASTPWVSRTREFARTLRVSTRVDHGLLLVGTPDDEPWHLAAHLDDESRFAGLPELAPVLVRHSVPDGAPPHLAVTLDRIQASRRGETLFIVAPGTAPERLLERADDAKKAGATILSMHTGDAELASLAHESLIVPSRELIVPTSSRGPWSSEFDAFGSGGTRSTIPRSDGVNSDSMNTTIDVSATNITFDVVEHLVSTAVGESAIVSAPTTSRSTSGSMHTFRDRLGRLLDAISGSTPQRD